MKRTVLVQLSMRQAQAGGRRSSFSAGYVPHLVVVGSAELLGVRAQNTAAVSPGEKVEVSFELMYPNIDYGRLVTGARVSLVEGSQVVGEGVVTKGVDPDAS